MSRAGLGVALQRGVSATHWLNWSGRGCSDEAQLVSLRAIDGARAGRAPEARLDRRATQRVTHRLRIGGSARAPIGKQAKNAGELEALVGEGIGESRWSLG